VFPTPRLTKPGLFITATDTEVGKTVTACAIAHALHRNGLRVGVCKPFATGCRKDREGLVSEDAEALAHFADCRQPLDVINPIRYAAPLAPAVAAEAAGTPPDFDALHRALRILDESHDCLIIEGVGGLLVPIDPADAQVTVLDLIKALGLPAVVVTRATLGTLNQTTMTVRLLKQARCRVAGIVINGYEPDEGSPDAVRDPSLATNRQWLAKMTRVPILATIPRCKGGEVMPHKAKLPGAVIDAVGVTYWPEVMGM
jgi:dethiobiotin synthetase